MIQVRELSKSYGPIEALRALTFEIGDGEIVGLLGPNGAGKTTLIKTLTGYLEPDEGDVRIDGLDVNAHLLRVQAGIGYLPENTPLYPELTVQAYLKLMADLHLVPPSTQAAQIAEAAIATGLTARLTQPIGELSKGFRQRVGLAQAILHRPRLLILDEPTIGLDPTQIVEIRDLIKRLTQHSTILFSTLYFQVAASEIRSLQIVNANGALEFTQDENGLWRMAALTETEQLNPGPLIATLPFLTNLSMVEPLGKQELAEYGLDQPNAVLTLTLVGSAGESHSRTLTIGAPDEQGLNYVVKSSSSPYYVLASGYSVGRLIASARDDFLTPPLESPTPAPEAGQQ